MWTPATRRRHSREHLRYASDVSDEEWALLEPHLPAPCLTGRPRAWPMREIVEPIFYASDPVAPGGSCPTASRRGRRVMAGSPAGA